MRSGKGSVQRTIFSEIASTRDEGFALAADAADLLDAAVRPFVLLDCDRPQVTYGHPQHD